MGNCIHRNFRKTSPSDGIACVSVEGTRAHCGHSGQQEGFGDSYFFWEDIKDNLKKKVLWKMGLVPSLYLDFLKSLQSDIVSQSMISVCFRLKDYVWQSNIYFGLQSISVALRVFVLSLNI